MTAKDTLCNDIGTSAPYIARSRDDVHYGDPSRFVTCATFTSNVAIIPVAAYAAAVAADSPVNYERFSETGVVTAPNPFTAADLGTVGPAGTGTPLVTSYGISTTIRGSQPGVLAEPTNTAFSFPSTGTNPIVVSYRPEWNCSGPFSVELWLTRKAAETGAIPLKAGRSPRTGSRSGRKGPVMD